MALADSTMTLKLLIDAGNNKVFFAESGKDFVDFMFSLLLLPLGSIMMLVTPRNTVGSIGNLYQSVENISDIYLVANLNKSTLLQPTVSALAGASPLLLTGTVGTPLPKNAYYCTNCLYEGFISDRYRCKYCCQSIDCTSGYNVISGAGNGFVKGVMTYMITDDLEVTPMSAISSITLINRFILKKNVQLEEKAVVIGMEEGLALLEASLKSATALTDVFLNSSTKKARRQQAV